MKLIHPAYLWVLLLVGCSKDKLTLPQADEGISPLYSIADNSTHQGMVGTWLLYEQGSSPGYGYNVEAVSPIPLQTLTFTQQGEVSRQENRLEEFFDLPYYRVDSSQTKLRLHLSRSPNEAPTFSMVLRTEANRIHLDPGCQEGCHYSFVRIRLVGK